jgi:hypothetical protein
MCSNVRIQLPLGLKRKFLFFYFANVFAFSQNFSRKLKKNMKIAETLMMWTTWGMVHKIELLTELGIDEKTDG